MAQGPAVIVYVGQPTKLAKLIVEWPLHSRFPYLKDTSAMSAASGVFTEVFDFERDDRPRLPSAPQEITPEMVAAEVAAEETRDIRVLNRYMLQLEGGHYPPFGSDRSVLDLTTEEKAKVKDAQALSLPQICARELCFHCHNFICTC